MYGLSRGHLITVHLLVVLDEDGAAEAVGVRRRAGLCDGDSGEERDDGGQGGGRDDGGRPREVAAHLQGETEIIDTSAAVGG